MMVTCRIELEYTEPLIWRTFQFHHGITFHQLHLIIQTVMGWEDEHLYQFEIKGKTIGISPSEFDDFPYSIDDEELDSSKELVQQHVNRKNASFRYTYDFGDGWEHRIKVTGLDEAEDATLIPVCLDGARCCPPEDIGGVGGYEHFMEALSNPGHPDRDEMLEWLGDDFDPEFFSAEAVNQELRAQADELVPRLRRQPSRTKRKPELKLKKSDLNHYLKQLDHAQLINLVKACFDVSKETQKFLATQVLGNEAIESLFEEYRGKVEGVFFPQRG